MRDVRNFYNRDGWKSKNHQTLDSVLFEDTRKCASDYVSSCRKRILKYIPKKGEKNSRLCIRAYTIQRVFKIFEKF